MASASGAEGGGCGGGGFFGDIIWRRWWQAAAGGGGRRSSQRAAFSERRWIVRQHYRDQSPPARTVASLFKANKQKDIEQNTRFTYILVTALVRTCCTTSIRPRYGQGLIPIQTEIR